MKVTEIPVASLPGSMIRAERVTARISSHRPWEVWENSSHGCRGSLTHSARPFPALIWHRMWKSVAQQYPDDFLAAQHDYIKAAYYDPSVSALAAAGWHIENHAAIMQDVIWSRAVQFGVGNIVDMWNESCSDMGYPNLSYIDAQNFDHDLIVQIYQTCISWNGSLSNRFISERADALAALGT